jgi:hypothetical protein
MRRFPGPPPSTEGNEDPYAEFPSETADRADAPQTQDWLAEFPDEKPAAPSARTKGALSKGVTDRNG